MVKPACKTVDDRKDQARFDCILRSSLRYDGNRPLDLTPFHDPCLSSVFLKQGNDVVPLNFSYRSCVITKALYIFSIYTAMKKVRIMEANEITVRNIQAYMERTVTRFGSGAKVDCPKEFLGKKAYLIIERDEE